MQTISGIKIVKNEDGKFYGTIDNEELTNEFESIEKVAEIIDNYYYNLYNNSGYTTTYRLNIKKQQPKTKGVVATMSIKLLDL